MADQDRPPADDQADLSRTKDFANAANEDTKSASDLTFASDANLPGDGIPTSIGRYSITRPIGHGAFGRVYLARDEQLERDVAIKVPHPELVQQPDLVEIYLAEAKTVARLDHPHIVPVHDVGQSEGIPFYVVSKFVLGQDLKTRLNSSTISLQESVQLVEVLAEALHHAHKRGFVHRDVKPGNILLDEDNKPYLVDFGLALQERDLGKGPRYAGTPAYMSPEQARGEGHRVDGRSDIFALGVVLYELIVGRRPFKADTAEGLLEQINTQEAKPPRQIDDSIPKELERICLKALAKRSSERYTTALDLAEDLRHFQLEADSSLEASGGVEEGGDWRVAGEKGAKLTPVTADSTRRSSPSTLNSSIPSLKIVPKGLRSFDAHDADFFLELLPGPRDRDGLPDSIRFWKTRIEETDPDDTFSVGLIYGPSGCGKSSLVKAGLLPRLSSNIVVVYLEATPNETETRLSHLLRKRRPSFDDGLSLSEMLATLRRRPEFLEGKKVLIVIDQFEQWLYSNKPQEHSELVNALRQCDGGRVQCIVMLRDDFWMAATRFMRELDIRLVEAHNSAAVDLFPIRHARQVLRAFGVAYGAIANNDQAVTQVEEDFVSKAVDGLAEEDKVICVRLALFAEMVKGKSWNSSVLKDLGGTQGVGVTFLDEIFNDPSSPPEHRYHQKAAHAVLKALLPNSGTNIKGHIRSDQELLEASGYGNRKRDFDDLIRILDSDLRLITPVDVQEVASAGGLVEKGEEDDEIDERRAAGEIDVMGSRESRVERGELGDFDADTELSRVGDSSDPKQTSGLTSTRSVQQAAQTNGPNRQNAKRTPQSSQQKTPSPTLATPNSEPTSRFFQLTHDYLVPALREWLNRKQKETRRGRAELALAERAAVWDAHSENRQLPSLLQWGWIRWHTNAKGWSPTESRMMVKSTRVHGTRMLLSLALLLVLGFVSYGVFGSLRARATIDTLLAANPQSVSMAVDKSVELRFWTTGELRRVVDRKVETRNDRIRQRHARLALVNFDQSQSNVLLDDALTTADTAYVSIIRETLMKAEADIEDECWAIFRNDERGLSERFRAGLMLVGFAPESKRWTDTDFELLVDELVTTNAVSQPQFWPLLQGCQDQILPRLEALFRDRESPLSTQVAAANALNYFLEADIDRLLQLLLEANGSQYKVLYDKCREVDEATTKSVCQATLLQKPSDDMDGDARILLGKRRANSAITLLRLGDSDEGLDIFRYEKDPEGLTQFVHGGRDRGIHPATLINLLEQADQKRGAFGPSRQKTNDSLMYGLLLSLGEFAWDDLPANRDALVERLNDVYALDPSSGVHSATGWLLRKWGQREAVDRVDQTAFAFDSSGHREWYVEEIEYKTGGIVGVLAKKKRLYFTFIVFPPNEFVMGSPENEPGHGGEEAQHRVKLTRPIAVCDRELTWAQWEAFGGNNKRQAYRRQFNQTLEDDDPMFGVKWYEAVYLCCWLNATVGYSEDEQIYGNPGEITSGNSGIPKSWPIRDGKTGFRLPTEAEWESFCRSGTETAFSFGHDQGMLSHYGWSQKNAGEWMMPTRQLRPNPRGLFDIHGNVNEWCQDGYEKKEDKLSKVPVDATDPVVEHLDNFRAYRGGSYYSSIGNCRSSSRGGYAQTTMSPNLGIRLVRELER